MTVPYFNVVHCCITPIWLHMMPEMLPSSSSKVDACGIVPFISGYKALLMLAAGNEAFFFSIWWLEQIVSIHAFLSPSDKWQMALSSYQDCPQLKTQYWKCPVCLHEHHWWRLRILKGSTYTPRHSLLKGKGALENEKLWMGLSLITG